MFQEKQLPYGHMIENYVKITSNLPHMYYMQTIRNPKSCIFLNNSFYKKITLDTSMLL